MNFYFRVQTIYICVYMSTLFTPQSVCSTKFFFCLLWIPCHILHNFLEMKLLAWMQQKLGGRNGNKKQNQNASALHFDSVETEAPKEEIRDWPHELLTIGTLGSNCTAGVPESLKEEILTNTINCHDDDGIESKTTLSFPGKVKGKDLLPDHHQHPHNVKINKRSLSFLLNKAFVCNGGFSAPSSPRRLTTTDQLHPDSAMEKILKSILNKKIYPQNPAHLATLSRKMYLENRHKKKQLQSPEIDLQQDCGDYHDKLQQQTGDEGSKWDKTDSEYIVLEI